MKMVADNILLEYLDKESGNIAMVAWWAFKHDKIQKRMFFHYLMKGQGSVAKAAGLALDNKLISKEECDSFFENLANKSELLL